MREDLIGLAKQQAAEIARAGHNGWGNTMLELAAALEAAQEQLDWAVKENDRLLAEGSELTARAERLAEALDIIARVGKGSRKQTTRTRWIVARAISALNGDDDWQALSKPKGFHDALLRPTDAQENSDA